MHIHNDTFGDGGISTPADTTLTTGHKVQLGSSGIVSMNRSLEIKQEFFSFIKANGCKGTVKETTIEN